MYKNSFKLLIWGIIFSTISVPITKYDFKILPNFLGYILFLIAFIKLKDSSEHFKKLIYLMIPFIPLALFSYFYKYLTFHMGLSMSNLVTSSLTVIESIFQFIMLFHIFMGIQEMANSIEASDIGDRSAKLWDMNIKLIVFSLVGALFMIVPFLDIIVLLGLLVYSLYVTVKTVSLFIDCSNRFK
ncbi:hypothetical protein [Clostridium ganghwense]|uniref:Uncharacterized protein n=1 Tax=Clostridium ganghwense TaxID=312089 RepID=A0ABT4CVZ9_9CLOT|nr:hypothetical protein [Clostridium ganghwense]MCY6372211.1 hypothetical protein [Clostridium ganghwense]